MVRINPIPKVLLADQHLNAEWNESFMLIGYELKHGCKGVIPKTYRLGTGHIKFFTDKLAYIFSNLHEIGTEMGRRGFKPDWAKVTFYYNLLRDDCRFDHCWKGWVPTKEAQREVIERIIEKHHQKPNYYNYKGKKEDGHCYFILRYNDYWHKKLK